MHVLTLCTYPIKNPKHGGQLRVRSIVDAYRAAGNSVEIVGVLGSEQYETENGFLAFPGLAALSRIVPNPFLMEDYAIGELCASDESFYQRLVNLIHQAPDAIHIEQPWLYSFAMRYRNEFATKAKVIYGSQNVEYRLKREILASNVDVETARQWVDLVKQAELNAIYGADALVCVSEGDLNWVGGHTSRPVILAPNGVKSWQSTPEGRREAARHSQESTFALYCASAHPPNITGFFDLFGGGFGSLKPDEKLVIAGGAGLAIARDERIHHSSKLAEKVVVAGYVSQPCLEGLLDGAHCIVLPLTQGGGTNLKTAEALWSGKYIVATTVAMRGFERFIGASGILVADEPSAFKRGTSLGHGFAAVENFF